MRFLTRQFPMLLASAVLGAMSIAQTTTAQVGPIFSDEKVDILDVELVDRNGDSIDLDLPFTDESGRPVVLGDYFDGETPVIVTLNYYRCPMLCTLTLNGLADGLTASSLTPGKDFKIVTLSFVASEGSDLARAKKDVYLSRYQHPDAAEHWHFLTGDPVPIQTLSDQLGFSFKRDDRSGEYSHPSATWFITPDGVISKTFDSTLFKPRDLEFMVVEASNGNVGSPVQRFLLLTCFDYDPAAGSYAPSARKLMRAGGYVAVVSIAIFILILMRMGSRRNAVASALDAATSDSSGLHPKAPATP